MSTLFFVGTLARRPLDSCPCAQGRVGPLIRRLPFSRLGGSRPLRRPPRAASKQTKRTPRLVHFLRLPAI